MALVGKIDSVLAQPLADNMLDVKNQKQIDQVKNIWLNKQTFSKQQMLNEFSSSMTIIL